MRVTQKNVRVFHIEIDEEEAFLDYFQKNLPLLKEFFLLIDGNITQAIVSVLDQSGVCYKEIGTCAIRLGNIKKEPSAFQEVAPKAIKQSKEAEKPSCQLRVFDRPIRSGEEIHEASAMAIFGRVNSGAKVFCDESMSIYGIIDGLVQCDGEYLVMNGITPRGHLIFNGEIVERNLIKENKLQKITIREGLLEIKEVV